MGKHKKHHKRSSSSSSSSSSSDDEYRHLPKDQRKMMRKQKKLMKKGKLPHGAVMGKLPVGKMKGGYGGQPHGYPQQPGYPAGGYPMGGAPPPSSYPTGTAIPPTGGYGPPAGSYPAAGGYPASGGYPAAGGSYPQAPNPAYPAAGGYPQPGYPAQPPPPAGYNPGGVAYAGQPYPTQPPAGGFAAPPSGAGGGFAQPPAGGAGYGAPPSYGAPQQQQGGVPYGPPGGVPQQPSPTPPSYAHSGVPGGPHVGVATAGMASMNIKANMVEKSRPTIVPVKPFSAEEDAKILRKAMKGIGTDEKAIVDVVSRRTNQQRQEILIMFKTLYGKDLIQDLKSELSGDLEELILALFKPTTFYDAYSLKKAMEGVGTKESVLIEILLTRTNAEIKEIVACYQKHFGRNLEKDIMDETSGHFKRLLVSACQGNRNELKPEQLQKAATQGVESVIDRNLAREEAQKLYQAGAKRIGTDESAFLQVMALRHYYQLRATFEEYQKLAGKDIISAVKGEMSGDLEDGFKALVMSAKNRPLYFAERLHKAMAGFGTKDSTLIRIIVSRSEIDLQDIKDEYRNHYQKSLHDAVASETSGDYKKLLLGIIGQ